MKSKEEIIELSNAVGRAIREYHKAIADNLKESGKEFSVEGDDEDTNGLRLDILGRHNDLVNVVVDKVRYYTSPHNSGAEYVQVHICEEEYKDCDYWMMADYFGDDMEYVYENIVW